MTHLMDNSEKTVRKVLKGSKTGDSREPIKVYLRVKPLTDQEIEAGESKGCLEIENSRTVALHPPKTSFTFKHQSRNAVTAETIQRFTFSRVFGPETNQRKFFEDTSLDFVKDFINGQNCLVFSYGITNAGKTYTILGDPQNAGVLPRTLKILFNSFKDQNYERSNMKPKMFCDVVKLSSIEEESEESKKKNLLLLYDVPTYHQSISSSDLSLQEQHSQEDIIDVSSLLDATSIDVDDQGPIKFSLWISFAEIYNEYIYDLLEPISMNKETRRRTALKVGDDRKGNPYVKGLTEIHVNNADEACKLLKIGRKNQRIASTKLNQNSSRSHCIFTLKILRVVNTKEPHVARVSRLSFVDLAGSERYTKTQNTGARLKEAGNINTSIMTLGKCVELLRYNQNHVNNQKNIPFRESKLTRLVQDLFSGKGKASMIVNVNQCATSFDETLHTLKFSAIAKKVTTIAHCPQPAAEIPRGLRLQPAARSTRSSVAWADGSLGTPVGNKVQTASDDVDATVTEEDTVVVSPAGGNQDYYLKIITELQAQLIEERKQKTYIEMKIREEVCQEMADQIVEIEKNYNERMVEEQRATEELYEKRMDILSQSVKKARKRPRVEHIEDDDDEWVSSVFLHAEQVKNKELSERVTELEREVENCEKKLSSGEDQVVSINQEIQVETQSKELLQLCEMKEEKESLLNEIRAVQAKNDELLAALEERNKMVQELQEKMATLEQGKDALEEEQNKIVQELQEKMATLEQGKDALEEEQNKTVQELQEKMATLQQEKDKSIENLKNELASRDENIDILEKARAEEKEAKTVAENQIAEERIEEVRKAEQRIFELEKEISSIKEDNGEVIKSLEKQLAQREDQVLSLEKVKESLRRKDDGSAKESNEIIAKLEEDIGRVKGQKEKEISDLRKAIEHRDKKILSLEEIMAKNEKLLAETDMHAEELRKKDSEICALGEQVNKLESKQSKECQSLRKELKSRDEQLEHLERSLKDSKVQLEAKSTQLMAVKKVQGGRPSTPTKSSHNNLVKQLEKRLQESTAALDKKNSQLIGKNNAMAKLENSLKELRANLAVKEQELSELNAKIEQMNASKTPEDSKDVTINELNAQLNEQLSDLSNKTKEKEEIEENLKFVEGELHILSSKQKETQEEIRKLTKQRDEMKDEAQTWMLKVKNFEEEEGNLKKQLETQARLVEEHEGQIEELQKMIESKEEDLRRYKDLHSKQVSELKDATQELQQNFAKELKQIIESKEEDLRRCKDLHNKEVTELNDANRELQQNFDKALQDLTNVQATVVERNQKLDDMESRDSSLKNAIDTEVVQMRKELKDVRDELQQTRQARDGDLKEFEDREKNIEKEKLAEILKVKENCETDTNRLKKGLEGQDEILAQMEKDLASKEEEIADLNLQVEKLLQDSEKVKELSKENEDLDEQCERLKIKIFELETEVEKLQQEVKKETTKKDTATQALRDGLEIVKVKKLEYETKKNDAENEKEELKKGFEMKISDLEQELERLKSVSSETDEKTDSSDKESGNSSNGAADYVYKPVEVESFNLPEKDRMEIDVTPITGSGLRKGSKKTASGKAKGLKRKSSDLTLKEVRRHRK
ncbi:kinesin KIF20B isoform X1, partial [Paramuricea clavata]